MGLHKPTLLWVVTVGIFSLHVGRLAGQSTENVISKSCEAFHQKAFFDGYSIKEEEALEERHLGNLPNATVVWAQTGNCKRFAECPEARALSFQFCRFIEIITECRNETEGSNGLSLIWDDCKDDMCTLKVPVDVSKCMVEVFGDQDADDKANGTCVPETAKPLLNRGPMTFFSGKVNGTHCLLPLPANSFIFRQVKCLKKGNEPQFNLWYQFSKALSPDPYSCALVSQCKNVEDPADFVCISDTDAAQKLKVAVQGSRPIESFSAEATEDDSSLGYVIPPGLPIKALYTALAVFSPFM